MVFIKRRRASPIYIRNIIFGVEDSLVSTVGLLSGVAITGAENSTIVLMGIVLLFVEAFSMGVGSLLSEDSVEQFEAHGQDDFRKAAGGGVVMFFSYFLAGFIPLFPYFLFQGETAFWLSVTASLAGLFVLGAVSGRVLKFNVVRNGLKMLLLGGMAVALGVAVGILVDRYR